MIKAYIVLAHKNGEQVYRMLKRLDDNQSFFFLHIDKNSSLEEFKDVVNTFTKKIKLVKRVAIEWGGFGLVQATINALQEIKKHPLLFEWIILLSGQDYPIKPNNFINQFLKSTSYEAFFEYTLIPNYPRWSPRGGSYRVDKYYFGSQPGFKIAAKFVNFFAGMFPVIGRPVMRKIKPYAGSQWWVMNANTMNFVLNYIEQKPYYTAFHKFTFAADEVFFHSIILNSDILKDKVENNNKRFYIWPDTSKAHPELLEEKDLDTIKNSDALFARKFDLEHDPHILDSVDNNCIDLDYQNVSLDKTQIFIKEVSING